MQVVTMCLPLKRVLKKIKEVYKSGYVCKKKCLMVECAVVGYYCSATQCTNCWCWCWLALSLLADHVPLYKALLTKLAGNLPNVCVCIIFFFYAPQLVDSKSASLELSAQTCKTESGARKPKYTSFGIKDWIHHIIFHANKKNKG